jgi:hypothetical protein
MIMTTAMMITMPRPRALPMFVWPAMTFPFRNDPIWIEVSGIAPAVSASAVA